MQLRTRQTLLVQVAVLGGRRRTIVPGKLATIGDHGTITSMIGQRHFRPDFAVAQRAKLDRNANFRSRIGGTESRYVATGNWELY